MSSEAVFHREEGKWALDRGAPQRADALELLRRHNPFYLASAACMLLGCYLLAAGVTGDDWTGRTVRVMTLWGTLSVYEVLVVGLACYLISRRRQMRDGLMLLMIEVLLLADSTNLLNEAYALSFRIGLRINLAALTLAAAKAAVAIWVLRLRYSPRELAAAAIGYLGMLAVPGMLAAVNRDGGSMDLPIHAAWWILGLLPVVVAVVLPRGKRERSHTERLLGAAALAAPWISMLVRVSAAAWVYEEEFQLANLAPMAIGCAAVGLWRGPALLPERHVHTMMVVAGAFSLFTSAFASVELEVAIGGEAGPVFSPMRAVTAALALLYLAAALKGQGAAYWPSAATLLAASCSGHSMSAIWNRWADLGGRVVPETKNGWGVLAVVLAFAFLAAGGALSMLRRNRQPAQEGDSPGGP